MNAFDNTHDDDHGPTRRVATSRGGGGLPPPPMSLRMGPGPYWGLWIVGLIGLALVLIVVAYNECKIEVGTGEEAVLIRRSGLDLEPGMELAPPRKEGRWYYKGVQTEGSYGGVLLEGRYFYNPFYWSWEILPQFVIPDDKIGIKVALSGEELPAGQVLAEPGQKGILREVLKPGRYPYNPYAVSIELHDPITVPTGFRGVVTLLAGTPAARVERVPGRARPARGPARHA